MSTKMHPTLEEWLPDVLADEVVINSENEARINTWTFSIPSEKDVNKEQLQEFIQTIFNNRESKVDAKAIFYLWYDDQSGNLSLSITSNPISELPFGCIVNIVNTMEIILDECLNDSNPGVIPFEEVSEVEEGSTEIKKEYTLNVWAKALNEKDS